MAQAAKNRLTIPCVSAALSSGLDDKLGDLVGMGDQREMACLDLHGFGAHALGHETLEIGVDRSVFS